MIVLRGPDEYCFIPLILAAFPYFDVIFKGKYSKKRNEPEKAVTGDFCEQLLTITGSSVVYMGGLINGG